MSKYFHIQYTKELADTLKLIDIIKKDGWFNNNTVLVNCFPEYSSRTTQMVNHKLSYLNKNELFEVINLEMPYPNMSQVYDSYSHKYEMFDRYLAEWVKVHIDKDIQYLLLSCGIDNPKNFNKIRLSIRQKLENSQFRIAAPYYQKNSLLYPDYFVQEFEEKDGGLLFEWENMDNPNWNY